MDLTETVADRAFRLGVRAWLRANAPGPLPTLEDHRGWHRKLYEAGFIGMLWPVEYGGRGARPVEQAIVAEEMAGAHVPGGINHLGLGYIGQALIAHGTEAQKRRHLRNILTATDLWCQLFSEPDAGSDLASLRTSATRHGDGYVVNGRKLWTSQGPTADFGLLLARTDPGVPKHDGLSCFIVDMHSPGVEVRPLRQITGDAEFAEVLLTDLLVSSADLVGRENAGWRLANSTLGLERADILTSRVARHKANLLRLADACVSLERDGQPLIESPVVRQKLGRMFVETEVARYRAVRIVSGMEQGAPIGDESSVDKLSFSELERRHGTVMQEVLGSHGQIEAGLPSNLRLEAVTMARGSATTFPFIFLRSRSATIGGGTSEIQRTIIGERILKLPREARPGRAERPR